MNPEPLPGSTIKIDRDIYSTTYSWQNGRAGILQYPVAIFMLFWLGGWTVGGFMAAKELLFGEKMPLFGKLFILFWLGAWAFGEAAVIYALYGIFKPRLPAKLQLSPGVIEYQTGTLPCNFFDQTAYRQFGKRPKLFEGFRNKIYKFKPSENNLKLEYAGERQRLTFDIGVERVEIGQALSEPEREWLYNILMAHK